MIDAYQILGLSKDATKADIKKAYRKLASRFHPDKSKEADADEKFKVIKEAYEFLTTGKSSSGIFRKPGQARPPEPEPWKPYYEPYAPPAYKPPPAAPTIVDINFTDLFTAKVQLQRNSPFWISVPYGAQENVVYNLLVTSSYDGQQSYMNIIFKIMDPTGFYRIEKGVLACKVKITMGALLAEDALSLRNINTLLPDVEVHLNPKNKSNFILVDNAGLPSVTSKRGQLMVELELIKGGLENETYDNLKKLRSKVNQAIENYDYKVAKYS